MSTPKVPENHFIDPGEGLKPLSPHTMREMFGISDEDKRKLTQFCMPLHDTMGAPISPHQVATQRNQFMDSLDFSMPDPGVYGRKSSILVHQYISTPSTYLTKALLWAKHSLTMYKK